MRLVVWNCNMALHRKGEALRALRPDIAVLPEAACPEILERKGLHLSGLSTAWATKKGGTESKGLLVIGFGDYEVSAIEGRAPLDVFLPVRVQGRHAFDLLAVWSFNHRSAGTDFPIGAALDHYADMIAGGALVAGDLNHNVRWDKPAGRRNLAPCLDRLARLGHRSVYHDARGEAFGEETTPTLYWRDRTEDGPRYHIDYLFEPDAWRAARTGFRTGGFDEWVGSKLSDHVPLVCDWDDEALDEALSGTVATAA